MSRAKQLADAEADQVEREEEEAEREQEETPDAIEAESEALAIESLEPPSTEAVMDMLEHEHERHRVALETILGDDFAEFTPCAVCNEIGYRMTGDLAFDPGLARCDRCHGHGFLQTHSRNPEHAIRQCMSCQGQGFIVRTDPPATVTPPAAPVPRFDPFTGQPLEATTTASGETAAGQWAPGFVPPAQPAIAATGPRY